MIATPADIWKIEKIPVTPALQQMRLRRIIADGLMASGCLVRRISPDGRKKVLPYDIDQEPADHYLIYHPGNKIMHYLGFMQCQLPPDLDDLLEAATPNELHKTALYAFRRSFKPRFEWNDEEPEIKDGTWNSILQVKSYFGEGPDGKPKCLKMELTVTERQSALVKPLYGCINDILNDNTGSK